MRDKYRERQRIDRLMSASVALHDLVEFDLELESLLIAKIGIFLQAIDAQLRDDLATYYEGGDKDG